MENYINQKFQFLNKRKNPPQQLRQEIFYSSSNEQEHYGRRVKVNASQYPYSAIGAIKYGEEFVGTGFLIREKIVLTCAHNVYNREKKEKYDVKKMNFYLGTEKKQYLVQKAYLPEEYGNCLEQQKCQYDYAILILPYYYADYCYLGTQFFENKLKTYGFVFRKKFSLGGYPKVLTFKDQITDNEGRTESIQKKVDNSELNMYEDKGRIIQLQNSGRILVYEMETDIGQSGSPIFCEIKQDGDKTSSFYVVGIHLRFQKEKKKGVALHKKMLQNINKWIGNQWGTLEFKKDSNVITTLSQVDFPLITQLDLKDAQFMIQDLDTENIIRKLQRVQKLIIKLQNSQQILKLASFCNKLSQVNMLTIYLERAYGNSKQEQFRKMQDCIKIIEISLNLSSQIDQFPKQLTTFTNLQILKVSGKNLQQIQKVGKIENLRILNIAIIISLQRKN